MFNIESTQRFTSLEAETIGQTSIFVSWSLLETNLIFSNMTFSVYLEFNDFKLAGTTTDFFYEVSQLYVDVNYTIRVESVIPYSTQIISSTIHHLIELEEVTEPTILTNNMSQSTQTSVTTPTIEVLPSLFSEFSIYIFIGGIIIIVILLVLVVIITAVACCLLKKRVSKQNITPNLNVNTIPFEVSGHINEIYQQIDDVHLSEKGGREHTNPMAFELSALGNEAYGTVGNLNPFYCPDDFEKEIDQKKDSVPKTEASASHHYEKS